MNSISLINRSGETIPPKPHSKIILHKYVLFCTFLNYMKLMVEDMVLLIR